MSTTEGLWSGKLFKIKEDEEEKIIGREKKSKTVGMGKIKIREKWWLKLVRKKIKRKEIIIIWGKMKGKVEWREKIGK